MEKDDVKRLIRYAVWYFLLAEIGLRMIGAFLIWLSGVSPSALWQ